MATATASVRVISVSSTIRGLGSGFLSTKPGRTVRLATRGRRSLHSSGGGGGCKALYKPAEILTKEEGQPESLDYRVFFLDGSSKKISPWHDIPLHLGDGVFNFVVEIPKETSAKMEVATEELFTPIKQDVKKGKLRYYP